MTTTNEIWKAVPNYAGYEVSNLGNVRSYRVKGTGALRDRAVMLKPANANGYRFVLLRKDGDSIPRRVHQLVLEAFVGPRPEGLECAHLDGTRDNNRVENLAWVTHTENMSHKKLHGTDIYAFGEDSGTAKLTNADVLVIKQRLLDGEGYEEIAKDYPVDAPNIMAIHAGRTWNKVGPNTSLHYTAQKAWTKMDSEQTAMIVEAISAGAPITRVAKFFDIEPSTVSRQFKKATGKSVHEYRAWAKVAA